MQLLDQLHGARHDLDVAGLRVGVGVQGRQRTGNVLRPPRPADLAEHVRGPPPLVAAGVVAVVDLEAPLVEEALPHAAVDVLAEDERAVQVEQDRRGNHRRTRR